MFSGVCMAKEINWLVDTPRFPLKAFTKIRYNSLGSMALIEKINESYLVTFEESQLAITPGQSIVFYNEETLLGGGIIEDSNE